MEKTDGDGPKGKTSGGHPSGQLRSSSVASAMLIPSPVASLDGIIVLPLSALLRVLLPPLLIASLPKRAIGFSFPRGKEGLALGTALLVATATISYLLDRTLGIVPALVMVWLIGGTGVVMIDNSTGKGLAFVKQMCSTCRLRPIIEEHEMMHLHGEPSEDEVWAETRKRYSYESLKLAGDPMIHSFCPIPARLKETS
jgi:hypothetical protein